MKGNFACGVICGIACGLGLSIVSFLGGMIYETVFINNAIKKVIADDTE